MAVTIYLSSTYEDLKDYRRVVFDSLRQSGYQVIAMEDYVATDLRPADKCLKDVERADLYVGLFGFRYGYIPPAGHNNPAGLSITELEFRHAERLKKPCLTFLADPKTAGIPPQFVDGFTGDGESAQLIKRLREYLGRECMASFFSAPYQLASLVQAAVASHVAYNHKPELSPVQKPASSSPTWDIKEKASPYPGLMNFTRDYAPVFFGRDVEVREILDRMHLSDGRFIIVSGDSGVGKSSVIAAGVLPNVEEHGLPGGEDCEIIHMLPGKTPQPWNSLMMAGLGARVTRAGLRPDAIMEHLTREPASFATHIKTIVKKGAKPEALLLFLDQMEELFTSQELTQSDRFLSALYQAVQEKTLWVIATIRSDHLHYCHRHPEIVTVLRGKGYYPLGRVDRFIMREMIMRPAQSAGLSISERLARRMIDDMGDDGANLPLWAFALNQLFEKRIGHELSEAVYLRMGGVMGAIGAHVKIVEERIQKDLGYKTDEILPYIFQSLVNLQKEEGAPTRNHPAVAEFKPHLKNVLNLLVTERLLRTESEGESATVSICHEKLFEAWPILREYVETNKKLLFDRTLLESRARKWENMGKPWFSALASAREYKHIRRAGMIATPLTKEYLYASRRARWIQAGVIGFVISLIGGTGAWLWKEGATLQYAWAVLAARMHLVQVPAPEMVRIPNKSYAMGRNEVTFEEYDAYVALTGRRLPHDATMGREQHPVVDVTWFDAVAYVKWLRHATGKPYRLPTREEWLYAATGGGKEEQWAGTSQEEELADYAWYGENSDRRTHPVGTKKPNGLGLYDMSGNVWEWVQDSTFSSLPQGLKPLYDGRILWGGSMKTSARFTTVWYEPSLPPSVGDYDVGFRVAQDID